ncbi:MAG: radical SAM protein [Mariprofundaceae bacterium]|nr:radical SAM protein [Mariprofundaceae bacterium]
MHRQAVDTPPVALFLPDHRILLVHSLDDGTLNLHGTGQDARVEGSIAESLMALAQGSHNTTDQQRLAVLEGRHAWLRGLSQARTTPPQGLGHTLLRAGLGMLFVEVTARCNERCIHCYADSGPERSKFLSLDEIKSTLDQARELGRAFVQFTGGDPLIHPQLVEAVAHAANLDFAGIEIYTNGLLLSDSLLDSLATCRPRLSFSVYADRADIHDAITRLPGSWRRTLDAMRRAMQAGFEVRAGIVLMPENISRAEHMTAFLKRELGLDNEHIRFDPVRQAGRGRFMREAEQILVAPDAHNSSKPAKGKICISADAQVYPCIFARHNRLGNIREQSLAGILASLDNRPAAPPSQRRWQRCRQQLSCGDCQMIAYIMGDATDD